MTFALMMKRTGRWDCTRWCSCPLTMQASYTGSFRFTFWFHLLVPASWGWGDNPSCFGIQQSHDKQAPRHVSSETFNCPPYLPLPPPHEILVNSFSSFLSQTWVTILSGGKLETCSRSPVPFISSWTLCSWQTWTDEGAFENKPQENVLIYKYCFAQFMSHIVVYYQLLEALS